MVQEDSGSNPIIILKETSTAKRNSFLSSQLAVKRGIAVTIFVRCLCVR